MVKTGPRAVCTLCAKPTGRRKTFDGLNVERLKSGRTLRIGDARASRRQGFSVRNERGDGLLLALKFGDVLRDAGLRVFGELESLHDFVGAVFLHDAGEA